MVGADIRQWHARLALGRCSSIGCTSYHHNAGERPRLQHGLSYSDSVTRNSQKHHDQHSDTFFRQMHDRPHPLVNHRHSRPTAPYHILLYVHHSSLVSRSIVGLIVSWVSSKHSTRTRTCTQRPIYHFNVVANSFPSGHYFSICKSISIFISPSNSIGSSDSISI